MNLATCIMNFKKIGSKLWPWQCYRARIQNGCRDVINYANEPKLKRTPLDLWGTILWKFGWNRPSSFAILARTDTQTDRHTHTHTQTHTDTHTHAQTHTDTHRDTQRETQRETHRETQRDAQRDTERDTQKDTQRDAQRDRNRTD